MTCAQLAKPLEPWSGEVVRSTTDRLSNQTYYLLYQGHLFAYETACRKAGRWRLAVDMPCGLGIGVPLLSRDRARVIAIDLASKALRGLPNDVLRLQADAGRMALARRERHKKTRHGTTTLVAVLASISSHR
jgi:hypothetical protein